MATGVNHAAPLVPYALLYATTTLVLKELYRSIMALIEAGPVLNVRPNRRSTCCRRSPHSVPGVTTLMVALAVGPAERLRKSDGAITALVAT